MKRGTLTVLILVVFGMLFCSCSHKHDWPELDGVRGELTHEIDETATAFEVEITNDLDVSITFGSEYYIQKKRFGRWWDTGHPQAFTLEGYTVEANQKNKHEFVLGMSKGKIKKGEYRIVIPFIPKYEKYSTETFAMVIYTQK